MLYDEEYDYLLIDETSFDMRYLNAKNDGSIIKKYTKIYFEENEKIKSINIVNDIQLRKEDIIIKYNIEEINTTNTCWDCEYDECYFYRISDLGCFMKIKGLEGSNDNMNLKELIAQYDAQYKNSK